MHHTKNLCQSCLGYAELAEERRRQAVGSTLAGPRSEAVLYRYS